MYNDVYFLKQALNLAKKGMGWTNPNPMVGAVLVKNGRVIGKGYHKKVGLDHAEVEALKTSYENPRGSTLYINLEPCSHFGRTPPCTDAIIKAKIARVVCSSLDPNPKINGQGVAKLKKAGIDVLVGILEDEARILNEAFFIFHTKRRPFIALKFASSLDGKIATKTGDSKWITNEKARKFAGNLRGQYQAVLVGANTITYDNPHLGVRIQGKKDPLRIILDPGLKIPLSCQVLRDKNVLIITTGKADKQKKKIMEKKGFELMLFEEKWIPLGKLLDVLGRKEIISILVEGGGKTIAGFFDEGLFDKLYAFYAPIIIGDVDFVKNAKHLEKSSFKKFDDNFLMIGYA